VLAEGEWWEEAAAEGHVMAQLCLCGLDKEELVRQLQQCMPEHARTFVCRLIAITQRLCGRQIHWHLEQQDPPCCQREG